MHLSLAQRRRRYENGYVALCGIFAVLMVLTNIIGTKLFALFPGLLETGFGALSDYGPVILTTGLITYPLTFLFTDICSEIYGARRASVMVTIGFVASIIMLIVVNISVSVTPADRYWGDASGQLLLGTEVTAVDDKQVQIEHRQFLSDPSKNTAVPIAVMSDGVLSFASYYAISQKGGNFGESYRNCSLTLHNGKVDVGDIIIPAVQLMEFQNLEDNTRIRISGGFALPVQGVLKDSAGSSYAYTREDNDEWIQTALLKPDANMGSRPAAIVNNMTPIDMQTAMTATFASPSILLMASMLAYLLAQYLDVFMYHFWKRVTGGKKLWLRNNGSTWVSQFVDTITVNGIFLPIAFGMSFSATWNVIICVYIVKLIIAALDTPLIYLGVYLEKKRLGYKWEEDVPDLMSDKAEALI